MQIFHENENILLYNEFVLSFIWCQIHVQLASYTVRSRIIQLSPVSQRFFS